MTRRLGDVSAAPGALKTRAAGSAKAKKIDNSAFSKEGETRGDFTLPAFGLIRHTEVATKPMRLSFARFAAELQKYSRKISASWRRLSAGVAGPTVTLFKVDLPSGVRVSRIMSLTDDIAWRLRRPVCAFSRPFLERIMSASRYRIARDRTCYWRRAQRRPWRTA